MIIQTNIPALKAWKNLKTNSSRSAKRAGRLSSGYRINTAADDAAGLAISEKMRAQIRGLTQAERNTQDGISLVQTADGGMGEVHSMLHRMRELSVYACNEGVLTDEDTQKIQDEIDQLKAEIDGTAERTEFNKIKVLSGGGGVEMVQVGENVIMGVDKNTILDSYNVNITDIVNGLLRNDNLPADMTTVTLMNDTVTPPIPVLDGDGNTIDITFTFQKQANGSVDITAARGSTVLGMVNTGTQSGTPGVSQIWSRTYDNPNKGGPSGYDGGGVIMGMGNQFFIGGLSGDSVSSAGAQGMSFVINGTGDIQNSNVSSGFNSVWSPSASIVAIQPLPSGGYIVAGRTGGSSFTGNSYAIYDASGNLVPGGDSTSMGKGKGNLARDMILSQDGQFAYIAAGHDNTGGTTYITKINLTTKKPDSWNGTSATDWPNAGVTVNLGGGPNAKGLTLSNSGNPMLISNRSNRLIMFDDALGTQRNWDLAAVAGQTCADIGLSGVSFNNIEALGGDRYLLTGTGTNGASGTQVCATVVSLDDTGTGGTGTAAYKYASAFDAMGIAGINVGQTGADGSREIIFVGNRVGTNGNAQGWIGKLTDDGTQFVQGGQNSFDATGSNGATHCSFSDMVISTDNNGQTVYTVVGSTQTTPTDGASRDVWVAQFTEGGANAQFSLMGVDSVPMSLTPISKDGWDTEVLFNSVQVNFDTDQAIPGQTGYVTTIQIDATVNRYDWTVIESEPIYDKVEEESKRLWLQTGANAMQGFTVKLPDMHIEALGFPDGMPNVLNLADATASLDYIDGAVSIVSTERAKMGAVQNRLEFTTRYLQNAVENLSASESRIRDADMAKEMLEFTKSNVLQQAGISMLTQANQSPERVLQLLG